MEDLLSSFQGGATRAIGAFFGATWWFWLFFILFGFMRSSWLSWKQKHFEHHLDWILLELKIPRELLKNARGMDQLLQAITQLRNVAGDFQEMYVDGEVTRWYTFELCSFGGEVHFYMRVYKKQRGLVEAAFFSYYPDVEVTEVPDYIDKLPKTFSDIDASGADLWGSEMKLNRSPMYPIKSYLSYETPEESQQFDPIAVFLEVLGKAKPGEFVGIQFNAQPLGKDWSNAFRHELDELKKPKREKQSGTDEFGFPMMIPRSPGETDVIKAIEANLSKPAFKCLIRFIYISPKNIFYDSYARRGIVGAFNQYGSSDLNQFGQNYKMGTRVRSSDFPFLFPNIRCRLRKQRLLKLYQDRDFEVETFIGKLISSHPLNWNFHSEPIILSTESLATLFHPPMNIVLTAPHTKRVESRKVGPSAGLNIYGDEQELEQFIKQDEKII